MNVKKTIIGIMAAAALAGGVFEGTVPDKIPDVVLLGEIITLRTETAKMFDAGGGKRQAKIYTTPLHWNDNGTWKSIDTSVYKRPLFTAILSKYEYNTQAGIYTAYYDKNKPWDYRFEVNNSWIEYEALFEESKSLSIKVEISKVGVKETITLIDANAPTRLSWNVTRSGTAIITPPPTAFDADGKIMPIIVSQDGDILTYNVDTTNAVFPIEVDPTSVIATNDKRLYIGNATYTTARNAVTAENTYAQLYVGQQLDSGVYAIWRTFANFAIPEMSAISACSLFLNGSADGSLTDFNIYCLEGSQSIPLVVEDFDQFNGWQASGAYNGTILNNQWNSSSYSADWNEIVFDVDGKSLVLANSGSTLYLCLISNEDYNNSAPSSLEYVRFNASTDTGLEPYLSITFTPPPALDISGIPSAVEFSGIAYTGISGISP